MLPYKIIFLIDRTLIQLCLNTLKYFQSIRKCNSKFRSNVACIKRKLRFWLVKLLFVPLSRKEQPNKKEIVHDRDSAQQIHLHAKQKFMYLQDHHS